VVGVPGGQGRIRHHHGALIRCHLGAERIPGRQAAPPVARRSLEPHLPRPDDAQVRVRSAETFRHQFHQIVEDRFGRGIENCIPIQRSTTVSTGVVVVDPVRNDGHRLYHPHPTQPLHILFPQLNCPA